MEKSYLTIIDRRGLRLFYDEDDETREFLLGQIRRPEFPPSLLAWAVIPIDKAELIRSQLAVGNHIDALYLLQQCSTQKGTIACGRNSEAA